MKGLSKPKFNDVNYCNTQNPKPLLVFALTVILFLNLTFVIPLFDISLLGVHASSNNSEDQSHPEGSMDDSNIPIQDDEGQEQQPSETPNNLNDPSTKDNNPDSNVGFLDSGAIDENILKGNDVSSQSIDTTYLTVSTFNGQEVVDYFGYQLRDVLGETVSVCVETVAERGSTVLANPHCFTKGFNQTGVLAVEPGQILIDIQYSPTLIVDNPSDCSIKYLVPKESKQCQLSFLPAQIEGDITPKPNSDFGKSMIGP